MLSRTESNGTYRRSLHPVSSAPPCGTPPAPGLSAGWMGLEVLVLVGLWEGWLETNRHKDAAFNSAAEEEDLNRKKSAGRPKFTGGLSTVMTLARTWDWGPAVFMSWRFCCRIWEKQSLLSFLIHVRVRRRPKQDLWEFCQRKNPHLVSRLNNLLRIGEKRHKLVWVLYLDGCAARLCHLFCFKPLWGTENQHQTLSQQTI